MSQSPRSRFRCSLETLESRALLATTANGLLDIVVLGDRYADLASFHADADRAIAGILGYQPFQGRADQIAFHRIENTQSLDSQLQNRLWLVDDALVHQIVDDSGLPHENIIVLVDSDEYGGAGGTITTSYSGAFLPDVVTHELAHSLASLRDEYSYGTTLPTDGQVHDNLFAGAPPATEWASLVAPDEYFLGGAYDNWYRPSYNSLMRSIDARYFNSVSIDRITRAIDAIAGPSQDTTLPTVTIVSPRGDASLHGAFLVELDARDNTGIARAQLYIDGELARNDTSAPFQLVARTAGLTQGSHVIQAKVYDAAGNVGVSPEVTITLTAAAGVGLTAPVRNTVVDTSTLRVSGVAWREPLDSLRFQIDGKDVEPSSLTWSTTREGVFHANLDLTSLSVGAHTVTAIASGAWPGAAENRLSIPFRKERPVTVTAPVSGATVRGVVPVRIDTAGRALEGIDIRLDGALLTSLNPPPRGQTQLAWNWETRTATDGNRRLSVTSRFTNGTRSTRTLTLKVDNLDGGFQRPESGSSIRGTVPVEFQLNRGAARAVSFLLDGRLLATDRQAPFAFNWNSTRSPDGRRTLSARIESPQGGTDTINLPVHIRNDRTLPLVSWIQPGANAQVDSSVTVSVRATDPVGIERVEVLIDNRVIGTSFTGSNDIFAIPVSLVGVGSGRRTLRVRAIDHAGNAGLSTSRTIFIRA
jgi:hypothetical protein